MVNTTNVTVATLGTGAGAVLDSYDPLLNALGGLAGNNFTATGMIYAPRTELTLAKLKDSTDQPLRVPDALAGLPRYSSTQVPVNLTVGGSSDCSDVFTADWSNLITGMRTDLQVTVLSERYADTGTVGLALWLRADVGVLRPAAFYVTNGVRP